MANECDHDWERETHLLARDSISRAVRNLKPPYWWDDEAIGVHVICTKCGAKGVELWTYSHTREKK